MQEWMEFNELVDQVQDLIDLGLFDEARGMVSRYGETFAGHWEMPFLLARSYMEQNKPHSAIPHLRAALRLDSRNPDCLLGLFYAYAQIGRLPTAARFLFRARRFHPESDIVYCAMIWYYTETDRLKEADEAFKKARSLSSSNPEVYRNGGIVHQKRGEYEEAEACFKAAIELSPTFDEARDLLGDQYLMLGTFDRAIELYRRYLQTSPNNIRGLSRLVFCLSQAEMFPEAENVARQIIATYPNSTVGYVDLSFVYLNGGDPVMALSAADKAVTVSPADAEAHRARAIALSEAERDQEAEAAFQKAVSLDPRNAEILRDHYNHLRCCGDFEAMERLVFRVIRMEQPYCAEDYWFLADHYRDQGNDGRAFEYLHKAFHHMPGESGLLPPMASILLDRGHIRFAVPFLLSYVQHSGWDETMNEFARHRRLKATSSQEGIRFLRYLGEHPIDFRQHLLSTFVRHYVVLSAAAMCPLFCLLAYLMFALPGVVCVAGGTGVFIVTVYGSKRLSEFAVKCFQKIQPPPVQQQSEPAAP